MDQTKEPAKPLAVSLAEKGYASVLLFSRGGGGNDTPCPKVHGVTVVCFDDVANNTRGEAQFAANYAEQHHFDSLMIVPGRPQATSCAHAVGALFRGKDRRCPGLRTTPGLLGQRAA